MEFAVVDYAVAAVSLGCAVAGLFIGFSGALGMLFGGAAAVAAGKLSWSMFAGVFSGDWTRAIATLVASILVFGVVRLIVKKTVHGFIAQPADAILGLIIASFAGFCMSAGGLWLFCRFGFYDEANSVVLKKVTQLVGGFF